MDGAGMFGSLFGTLLALALRLGGPVLYVVLQARALRLWPGEWPLMALPPLLMMGAAVAPTARLLDQGSNLAPILVFFMIPMALLRLVAMGAIRCRAVR